jgi:hypothetical protein
MAVAAADPRARVPVQTTAPGSLFVDGQRVAYTPAGALSASTGGVMDPTIVTTPTVTDPLTGVVATGAQAGAPGVWLPRGCLAPTLIGTAPALTGTAAWAAGQYIILRSGSTITWNGTAWAVYTPAAPPAAPALAVGATAGSPGVWTPGGSVAPTTLPQCPNPTPTTAWTIGQYNYLNGGQQVYWSGLTNGWLKGKAP